MRLHPQEISSIVSNLLEWFSSNARDLPWRRTTDPYAIWISEVMLQQTQVSTVIPFFARWIRELPSIQSLAKANPQTVLKLWEGLGYYSRARNLQRAALEIVEKHSGRFPTDFEQVFALPGIGPYTAGAICSIAYDQPTPILDGNVARVLSRLFMIRGDVRRGKVSSKLWVLAKALVQQAHDAKAIDTLQSGKNRACSSLNQSLMELGALICTPSLPQCPMCPLESVCRARKAGQVDRFPQRVRRAAAVKRREVAFVVRANGRILLHRRPAGAVNAGFFELPLVELSGDTSAQSAARKLGLQVSDKAPLCQVKHTITRFRITVDAFAATLLAEDGNGGGRRGRASEANSEGSYHWKRQASLEDLPMTSVSRKILKKLTMARHPVAFGTGW